MSSRFSDVGSLSKSSEWAGDEYVKVNLWTATELVKNQRSDILLTGHAEQMYMECAVDHVANIEHNISKLPTEMVPYSRRVHLQCSSLDRSFFGRRTVLNVSQRSGIH